MCNVYSLILCAAECVRVVLRLRFQHMLRWNEGELPMTSLSKLRAEASGVDMVDSSEEAVRNDEGTA